MKPLLSFLLIILISTFSYGQTFNYTHYGVEDGLASSCAYVAFQDSRNFMWIGTENGVSRFDGKSFDNFTTEDGLPDNDVLRIFEDSKRRIWFMTIGGHLSFYKDGKIFNEKSDPYLSNAFTGAGFYYAFEDSKKRIWFCSYNAIVSVLDGNRIFQIKILKTYPDFGACVDEDDSGRVYLYSGSTKFVFNEKDKTITEAGAMPFESSASYLMSSSGESYYLSFQKKKVYKLVKGIITEYFDFTELFGYRLISATADLHKNLYLGSQQGAFWLEYSGEGKRKIHSYLKNEWVNSVTADNEGNLWIMTRRNGVFVLPKQYKENKLFNLSSLKNENIYSLAFDEYNVLWIGASVGQFSCLYRDSILNFSVADKLQNKGIILNLNKDRNGDIWGCSDGHVYKIKRKSGIDFSKTTIISDRDGQRTLNASFNSKNQSIVSCPLFCASVTESNNILELNSIQDQTFYKRTFFVFYDFNDKLYVSNVDGLKEKTEGAVKNLADQEPLLRSKIIYIQQAQDSSLIFATDGQGLIFFKNGKVTKRITHENGLASDMCRKIKIFNDKIFVCSIKGLTEFTYRNGSVFNFINYNLSNGLPSNDVRDVELAGDNIYVGTSKGLSVLNSLKNDLSVVAPPVYFTSVTNNSKNIDWKNPFKLEYGSNDLTVNYNAITYANRDDIVYEYSFGKDSAKWKQVTASTLNFPDISPGNYLFTIRACKKGGPWSEPQSFSFSVDPPFYNTWWFESLIAFGFFGGITISIIYYNRRKMRAQLIILEKRNALNNERNRISADMHDDLGSDLTKISVIAELLKIQSTVGDDLQGNLLKISDFVKGARGKMDDIIWALNPSNDSVGNLVAYINRYCLNYFEGSGVEVEINSELLDPDVQINARQRRNIYLVIKEIANNSLKYANASRFYIHIKADENTFSLITGDNGKGINEDEKRPFSNGLKNINQRVVELNGNVNVNSQPGTGTNYEISFPINGIL